MSRVADELHWFGVYVTEQARGNLSRAGRKDTSTLFNEMTFKVDETKRNTTLTFSFGNADDYWQFVDKGVKGKSKSAKAPNSPFKFGSGTGKSGGLTNAIDSWVKRKRFQFRNRDNGRFMSYSQTAFLITRSIYQTGLETTNFWTKPFEKAFRKLPQDIYEAYALEVEEQLKVRLE